MIHKQRPPQDPRNSLHTAREYLLAALLTLASIAPPFHLCHAEEEMGIPNEYLLKAVCLYNFTQFARWPSVNDPDISETIALGVVGESPFGDAIQELQTSLTRRQKKNVTVVYHGPYQEGMNLKGSHVLFISASEKDNMRDIITNLGNEPVLTVSDTDGFIEAGGMISLVLLDNKVRWEINRTAIDMAGITVSVKLLQLALRVRHFQGQSEVPPYEMHREIHNPLMQRAFTASHVEMLEYAQYAVFSILLNSRS